METLKKKLTNPFDGLKSNDVIGIHDRCDKIAETIFCNYGIKCGDKIFRFAEIEFYYYKKEKDGENNWDADWNKETYPRNNNAGKLFYHYSGVDICFQCNFEDKARDNDNGEFGGILIRSLLDGDDKIIAGPLFCANTMLNACNDKMPELVPVTQHKKYEWEKVLRCGIPSDKEQESDKELYLCYYATFVDGKKLQWDNASYKISWDKKKGIFKDSTRNYKKERNFK